MPSYGRIQEALIEVKMFAVLLPNPFDRQHAAAAHGIVKDQFRFLQIASGDQDAHIMQLPPTTAVNGLPFHIRACVDRPMLADDGVTTVIVESGLKARGTPTLCKDGKIHLQFEAWFMRSDTCLPRTGEPKPPDDAGEWDVSSRAHLDWMIVGMNTRRACNTRFIDRAEPGKLVQGTVKDPDRLRATIHGGPPTPQ